MCGNSNSAKQNTLNYRLYDGSGQSLTDLSGNENHLVNGYTLSSEIYDAQWTNRGAYFNGGSIMTLPPNEISS